MAGPVSKEMEMYTEARTEIKKKSGKEKKEETEKRKRWWIM